MEVGKVILLFSVPWWGGWSGVAWAAGALRAAGWSNVAMGALGGGTARTPPRQSAKKIKT